MNASSIDPRQQAVRVRKKAARQGLKLKISRRQDPNALDYRGHWLLDDETGKIAFGPKRTGTTLDECEEALKLGRHNWKVQR